MGVAVCGEGKIVRGRAAAAAPKKLPMAVLRSFFLGLIGYNELIMESKPYADLLPHSIDAVFYQPDSTGAQIRQAKLTHENFLREYGDAVKGVPLVIYEGRVNRQSKRPFKLAPGN